MRALLRDEWTGEFLDYACGPRACRIAVDAWLALAPVDGLYFVRPKDPRMVWNYLRELGPRAVWRKICSRWAERDRNEKFVSCGIGRVLSSPAGGPPVGADVVFLAPKHPQCVDRLTLPADWLLPLSTAEGPVRGETMLWFATDDAAELPPWWNEVAGWDAESGWALSAARLSEILRDCRRRLQQVDWSQARRLERSPLAVRERDAAPPRRTTQKRRAALFGYGNYAKTVILPNVRQHLDVVCVHELDPLQLGRKPPQGLARDTLGAWRPDERWDACLIAGYHHTHAPLAVEALARGAAAVVEKPIATNEAQLAAVLAALEAQPGKLFECFQRRYTRLNDWAREDLELGGGEPVDYHAIVYEVPLPDRHWYRWPSSRTRLTSNGCHWIDHFLYLNEFSTPTEMHVALGPRGIVNVSLALDNGAYGTIVLTDAGSERIGVQDHVELRARGRTVFIENNARYCAEGRGGVIRRRSVSKLDAYVRMYREIARRIGENAPCDARRSVRVSAGAVLALEALLGGDAGATLRLHRPAA